MAHIKSYDVIKRGNQFFIIVNEKEELETPHGTIFHTPHEVVALQVKKDIELLGSLSYTSALSSLCHAFTYDNIQNKNILADIREKLIAAPYEDDFWFNPSSEGLPPARILWDHIFYDETRVDDVREWLKKLSELQLATVLTVYQSTSNMNLAYLFGRIIDSDNEGILIDIKNLYDNLLSSNLDSHYIERLFQIFKIFYTAEKDKA